MQVEHIKRRYISTLHEHEQDARDLIDKLNLNNVANSVQQDFFVTFAGQGRVRWHYGAAHPILSDIEKCYIAAKGRNWLQDAKAARAQLVLGTVGEGLVWFDFEELWQMTGAVIIVVGTCLGAFILSYFTPTVGLGCRSGGYIVFATISLGLFLCELLTWRLSSPHHKERMKHIRDWVVRFRNKVGLTNRSDDATDSTMDNIKDLFRPDFHQRLAERYFFRPAELINTVWLLYIVLAQTFGAYRNCRCQTSVWGFGGGYMDFLNSRSTKYRWVVFYWTAGTAVATTIMSGGLVYIVIEVSARGLPSWCSETLTEHKWCLQSHLSTERYENAKTGLAYTRRFRRMLFPFRWVIQLVTDGINWLPRRLRAGKREPRKSLRWTHDHHPHRHVNDHAHHQPHTDPDIEFQALRPSSLHRESEATVNQPLIVWSPPGWDENSSFSPSFMSEPSFRSDSPSPSPGLDHTRQRVAYPRRLTNTGDSPPVMNSGL